MLHPPAHRVLAAVILFCRVLGARKGNVSVRQAQELRGQLACMQAAYTGGGNLYLSGGTEETQHGQERV